MTMRVSLAMIVKNEEHNIQRCLESVKGVVDEMIVIDTGSTDNTKTYAENLGANVFDFIWEDDFSKARNFSLDNCSGDWILVLDADEYLSKNYKNVLQNFIRKGNKIGRINIKSKFEIDGVLQEANCFTSRLFPKGLKYEGRIHEQLVSNLNRVDTAIDVYHDGYFLTDKSERNISLLKRELKINENDTYFLYQLGKEYRNLEQFEQAEVYFSKSYLNSINNEGFFPNLVVEYLNITRKTQNFKKGLVLIENESKKLTNYTDFHFAVGSFYMEFLQTKPELGIQQLQTIENAYQMCLQIGENPKLNNTTGTGSFLASYNLGVYYEVLGQLKKAKHYYTLSANQKYKPAKVRLNSL